MMADFVTPRHSAVMERLRRRIELFRQHHNSCESRYETATLERLELERQQTFALHQRCLQAKAKRSNKHRQPQASGGGAGEQAGQRAPGAGGGGGGGGEHGDGGGTAEQSRNSTLIALQETVKRKLESAGSPLGRDQVNGYGDGFPPSKKACLDNGTANGSPLDSKLGISDVLKSNGTHGPVGEPADGGGGDRGGGGAGDFHRKEMKQEPDDILPIVPPTGGGNNSLFPDLNEQEWTELMEELNCSVVYEDIQDIFNDGFADRKDPLELAATPGGGGAVGGGAGGGAGGGGGGQSSQGLLPSDLVSVKAEFSPASAVFEQDSRTGSPHVRSTPSGPPPPPHPTSSPVASSSASSPALPPSQPAPPPRQLQPPPNHLLPQGPPVPKDLSPAQQLQQLAAQQQRAQHLHGQMQHKPPQPGAKFHNQGPHPLPHPPPWPQMANNSQSPLGGAFGMDKPTSPSLYAQDFNPSGQKQLLMPGQPNKGSPKAGGGGYMPGPAPHPNMLGHRAAGPPLSHAPAAGAPAPNAVLTLNNTKPLSHFEAGPGPPRPPNTQSQNKAALLTLLRQQQQQIKQNNSMNFRQHIAHAQDQNYPAPPHGPSAAMTAASGSNAMSAQPGASAMGGNHGNAAYMNSQAAAVAAVLKQQQQQQILEQQKQQQYMQRQQLMAEQEKQRQQDQQLQRHLTRPPPQYQDQPGPPANQNHFPPQQVNQFTASSQPMGSVGSMGGPTPSSRMFPQNQGMMGMNMGQSGGAPPPAASQADLALSSCGGGGGGAGVDVLYNNMNMHANHAAHPQPAMQRQQLGAMSASYRQNLMAQQHLKAQPNAAMLKQQQLAAARMPGSMQGSMGAALPGSMPGSMQAGQNAAWQQQLAGQPPSSNAGMAPNTFSNAPNAFHLQQQQQQRLAKMPTGSAPFGANPGGRPMGNLNPGQQMMQTNMAAAQQRAPPNPQTLGQPMANQQQAQQQQANQNQAVLSDLAAFGQPQGNGRQGLQCNQGYQVSRTANQQQQQVSFGYNVAAGSFAAESDLVDSLLKGQSSQEWMADLDELLANHH